MRIIAGLLSSVILLAGCGFSADQSYGTHTKRVVAFKNCSSVVIGTVTPDSLTSLKDLQFGSVKVLPMPDDYSTVSDGSGSLARYDVTGTFAIDKVGPEPRIGRATMADGKTLSSYWTGIPTPRADITFTFYDDWHGATSNTLTISAASNFTINQFTNLAYFVASSKGLTPASFAAATDAINLFFMENFPTQVTTPVNFAAEPLSLQYQSLVNGGLTMTVSGNTFAITRADFVCTGPLLTFPACVGNAPAPL